jgi:tetraacyldisaccharide 4'-kinase
LQISHRAHKQINHFPDMLPAMTWPENYIDIVSGEQRGPVAAGVRAILRSASWLYGGIATVRNFCYGSGVFSVTKVSVPVISIGNLTTGGTGKTPMVATVVRMLQDLGRQPGIVSRGYRADDTGINDEKRVLEHLCPAVSHVQNPDRIAASKRIINDFGIDTIVLDDGFQHRRIGRDLDLVLIDATNPFGYDFILPRGLLRESLRGLQRVDGIVITRCDQVSASKLASIEQRICRTAPQIKDRLVRVSFRPTGLLDVSGVPHPLSRIDGCRVILLTAIGNPQGFVNTCRGAGADIILTRFFPDHYHYTQQDLESVLSEATQHEVDIVVTTVKDIVKIQPLESEPTSSTTASLMALEIATVFESPDDERSLGRIIASAVSQN